MNKRKILSIGVILIMFTLFFGCTFKEDLKDTNDITVIIDSNISETNEMKEEYPDFNIPKYSMKYLLEQPFNEPIIQANPQPFNDFFSVSNWNLQIFGQKKASNEELLTYYASHIDDYDLIFIQEIRNKDQTAFPKLCENLPDYICVDTERAGTTSSKEQYGIIYNGQIKVLSITDLAADEYYKYIFERPPVIVKIEYDGEIFYVVNIHIKPSNAKAEIEALEKVINELEGDVIILGDLNADCDYYDTEEEPEFDDWFWVIPDYEDTTVGNTDCAYDRIIVNNGVKNKYIDSGVMREVNSDQSDHYLVWSKFY